MGHSVEARKQRWADLLEKPSGGRKFVFRIAVRNPAPPPVARAWPWLKAERVEAAWQAYTAMLERVEWLDDDLVPYMPVTTGTEIFAEALGCEVYRPDDNNPFAIPFVHTAQDAERIQIPHLEDTPLTLLFDMADELRRRGGPSALLRMVDIQSPMDIVAQIWDKTELFVAMLETPDAVLELAAKARTLQTAFLDEWFRRYGAEHVAHYPDYYVRQGMTLSADEVGNGNPRMSPQFFLEELNLLSERYGGIGIHCCANSKHQWPNFLLVKGLRLINLHQPPPIIDEAYALFGPHTAQMHFSLWHGASCLMPLKPRDAFPPCCNVVIQAEAEDRDEAQRMAGQFRREYDT
jgi:hypothetical protein